MPTLTLEAWLEAGSDVEGDKVSLEGESKLMVEPSLVSSVAADGICRQSAPVSMAIDMTGQREENWGSAADSQGGDVPGANVCFREGLCLY